MSLVAAPGLAELIGDAAVAQQEEPGLGERWPREVTQKSLQRRTVAGGNGGGSVGLQLWKAPPGCDLRRQQLSKKTSNSRLNWQRLERQARCRAAALVGDVGGDAELGLFRQRLAAFFGGLVGARQSHDAGDAQCDGDAECHVRDQRVALDVVGGSVVGVLS